MKFKYMISVFIVVLLFQNIQSSHTLNNLHENKYDKSQRLGKALHESVKKNASLDVIEKLIKQGADLNYRSALGDPALSWAIINRNEDAIILLIYYGANTDYKDVFGRSPNEAAKQKGLSAMFRFALMLYLQEQGYKNIKYENKKDFCNIHSTTIPLCFTYEKENEFEFIKTFAECCPYKDEWCTISTLSMKKKDRVCEDRVK